MLRNRHPSITDGQPPCVGDRGFSLCASSVRRVLSSPPIRGFWPGPCTTALRILCSMLMGSRRALIFLAVLSLVSTSCVDSTSSSSTSSSQPVMTSSTTLATTTTVAPTTTSSAEIEEPLRPPLPWLTDPLLSPLSMVPSCGSEEALVSWASSVKPGFPVDAAPASVLEAARFVPLMRDLEPACVTAIVGGEFAAWSSESADGSVLVRGVAGPFETTACYTNPDGRTRLTDHHNKIGSGHGIGLCDFRGTGTVVGGIQLPDGRLQRFFIEFGPAFVDPGPLIPGAPPDPVGDVMRRLMLSGELVTTGTKWLGSAVPFNWHTGYAPCSVFYTDTAPARTRTLQTVWAMDFCDAEKHVGQFVASTESLIPEDATLTDLGRATIASWSTTDGVWSVATTDQTQYGFLSVHGVDPSVSVDDLAQVLAASPILYLGVLPSLDP